MLISEQLCYDSECNYKGLKEINDTIEQIEKNSESLNQKIINLKNRSIVIVKFAAFLTLIDEGKINPDAIL